jgi:hypothetical protein
VAKWIRQKISNLPIAGSNPAGCTKSLKPKGTMNFNIESNGTVTIHHVRMRTSMNFGKINISEFMKKYNQWLSGDSIQYAFPDFSPEQREFIMTGITPEMWNSMFVQRTQ